VSLGEKSLVAAYRRERLSSGKIELSAERLYVDTDNRCINHHFGQNLCTSYCTHHLFQLHISSLQETTQLW